LGASQSKFASTSAFSYQTAKMKKFLISLLFIITYGFLRAQQTTGSEKSTAEHHKSKKVNREVSNERIHYGTASFYANKFEGRHTANGEIFSQKKLSAASNIIPLNEWVRVTNIHNKISVVLRITDRMHKNNKRLIDLSREAARKLKFTGYGLTRVKVELLGKKRPEEVAKE
jgi:rare lipoprotein A